MATRVCAFLGLVALGGTHVAPALAEDSDSQWRQTVVIYGMGAAIDGRAQIGPVEVPIDVSTSEIFDNLEFGAMGAYRLENDRWSFTTDVTYMALGGSDSTEGGLVRGEVDVDQSTVMLTVGRRLSPHFELLVSAAYFNLSTDLEVTGPFGARRASKGAEWVDPSVGLQFSTPFAGNWRLGLRADVGGFGVGSDELLHLLASVRWQVSERIGWAFGYRVIDFDYEEGSGSELERYDLTEQGPAVGVVISF